MKNTELLKKLLTSKKIKEYEEILNTISPKYLTHQDNSLMHLALINKNWKLGDFLINKGLSLFDKNKSGFVPGLFLFYDMTSSLTDSKQDKFKSKLVNHFFQNSNHQNLQDFASRFFQLRKKDNRGWFQLHFYKQQSLGLHAGLVNYPHITFKIIQEMEKNNSPHVENNLHLLLKNLQIYFSDNKDNESKRIHVAIFFNKEFNNLITKYNLKEDLFITCLLGSFYEKFSYESQVNILYLIDVIENITFTKTNKMIEQIDINEIDIIKYSPLKELVEKTQSKYSKDLMLNHLDTVKTIQKSKML